MAKKPNRFPKLHNAAWPGLLGRGGAGDESAFDLDTMLRYTANAEVDGCRFDGVDLLLGTPHVDIDSSDDDLKRIADKVRSMNLEIGTVAAPVWESTGGGSAMGDETRRKKFLTQVKKACEIAKKLRDLGVRPCGCVRIDTATSVEAWTDNPEENQKKIAATFTEACDIAVEFDEVLACEGAVHWGGIHSWKRAKQILEEVDRPQTLGFQADMAQTIQFLHGVHAPEDRLLPPDFDWKDKETFDRAYKRMANALRIWTVDLHIAQSDATLPPNAKLDAAYYAGFWLRDEDGLMKRYNHICWDGGTSPNAAMQDPKTWNDALETMLKVRDKHGWK